MFYELKYLMHDVMRAVKRARLDGSRQSACIKYS